MKTILIEDVDYCLRRVSDNGYKVAVDNKSEIFHLHSFFF